MALLLANSLLPTPLFELYRRTWNLTPADLSLIYAIYSASLIPSLLFLGGISDSIGRRRTMLISFAILALAALVFAFAQGLWWLIAARIVQGVAMGMGAGAAAAAIREWMRTPDPIFAAAVAVAATGAGSAFGALLGGTLAEFGPHPLALPYFVITALLACGAIAVARVPSCPHLHPAGVSASLNVPAAIRRPFLISSVQAFVGWAVFSIFIALVPAFLAHALDLHNLLVGATVVTLIQVGSVTASLSAQRISHRSAIVGAMVAMGSGIWLLLLAIALHSELLIAFATLLAGAGCGISYLTGLGVVGAIAPPEHRAETLAAFLVSCYLGASVPTLGIGIAATQYGLTAAFMGAAIALAIIGAGVSAFATDRNLTPEPA